jgi:hypothetical protein
MVAPHIAQVLLTTLELETRSISSRQNGGAGAEAQTRRPAPQWLH